MKRCKIMTGYNQYHWIDIKYCRQDMRRDGFKFVKTSRAKKTNRPVMPNEWRRLMVRMRIERLSSDGDCGFLININNHPTTNDR